MTTGLMRWNPETDLFRGRMDRLFNDMMRDVLGAMPSAEGVSSRGWMPAVDIRETANELVFAAELPGLTKDDVEITVENSVLTLSGERKFEQDVQGETWRRIERSFGAFSRSFTLPATVKTDRIEAQFESGILSIKLPKAEESKPRKVAIK